MSLSSTQNTQHPFELKIEDLDGKGERKNIFCDEKTPSEVHHLLCRC